MWGTLQTYKEVEKRTYYHCGNDGKKPYVNNGKEGGVNRHTRHGAGVPREDMYMFNGEITYGEIKTGWKCLMCNFERGRFGRFQVFGNVSRKRCYQSGGTERWNIPEK